MIAPPASLPRPASALPAWLAAGASLLLGVAFLLAGQGTLLRFAILAGVVLVGLILYFQRPIAYFHFTLWTWFLTPLVRRLVDWRFGFEDHNLVLLAPLLVSALAGLTVLRERHPSTMHLTPFLLCIAGILYGFVVSIVRWSLQASDATSLGEIVYGLFDWLAPLLLGLHLYLRWPMYKEHERAIQKTFLWAVILLGAYGIYQFVSPLAWDRDWLGHMLADLDLPTYGRPEPFQIRVWGTSNSPGVFANILMSGLLLIFFVRSRAKLLALTLGYSSFMLTLVRSSWLGWIIGLAVLARRSKGRQIGRLLISLVLLPIIVSPLLFNAQIATIVTDRLKTFQSGKQDESLRDRSEEYRVLLASLAADPFGEGLSNADVFHGYMMDSGIILLLYYCGWIGAALLITGITLCARRMHSGPNEVTSITPGYGGVVVALIFGLLSGNTLTGAAGSIFWICIGLGLSLVQTVASSSTVDG